MANTLGRLNELKINGYKSIKSLDIELQSLNIIIGANGVEKIIELEFDDNTKEKFDIAVKNIQSNIDILKDGGFFNDL